MKTSKTPAYDLAEMKALVRDGRARPTIRVLRYLDERYPDMRPNDVVREVLSQLEEADFIKSFELDGRPGTMADVYIGGDFDGVEWYVKAFIERDQLIVQIWSMCWDGSLH